MDVPSGGSGIRPRGIRAAVRVLYALGLTLGALTLAAVPSSEIAQARPARRPPGRPISRPAAPNLAAAVWPLPYGQRTGNRVQPDGRGSIARARVIVHTTPAPVRWLAATTQGGGPALLVAAEADGALHGMDLEQGEVRTRFRVDVQAMEESPPVIARRHGRASILAVTPMGLVVVEGGQVTQTIPLPFSPLSHPTPVDLDGDGTDEVLAVSRGGEVMLITWGRLPARKFVWAMQDSRIAVGDVDGDGRPEAVLFVAPTGRYPHGALGDTWEAAALVVVRVEPARGDEPAHLTEIARHRLPPDAVFEGMTPLLVDLDGDGAMEIVAVRSTQQGGSALVAFKVEPVLRTVRVPVSSGSVQAHRAARVQTTARVRRGRAAAVPRRVQVVRAAEIRLLAQGPATGQPSRWMHLLAAAPFGSLRQPAVATVRTPHVGGVLFLSHLRGGYLAPAADIGGYSTHAIGSRNLDQAAAADLDGNGVPEIVVPTQDRRALAGLEVRAGQWVEKWRHSLGEVVASNLVVADLDGDGLLDLVAADAGGRLHLFVSRR